ncbi:MAG: carbohydrate ABC transporter permease [Rhizobiales bacterium]|nr:carbohydrate ABC transporter permease [Hyphomicrobiales bacterium]
MADRLHNSLVRLLKAYNLRPADVPIWLIGLAIAALWIMPFVWMVSTSLKYPSDVMTSEVEWFPRRVTLENYVYIFTKYRVARWALNSIIVVTFSTFFSVLGGALAGYALARMNFPGKKLLFFLYIASLMVPIEVYAIPMLLGMVKLGLANSYPAIILPSIGNVFSVLIFRQFFLNFPRDLEDAARIDGAGHGLIFWKIALPLARAPLIAATVIVFVLNWNNFLWPLLITFDESMKTLPVGIAAFTPLYGTATQLQGFAASMAGVTVLSLPSVLVFLVLQRYFIQGISSGAIRG